ncbi:MAG: single-stranded DNA-binding protein [Deltaproteobacteria bacterium]|nr:single-stranded DNA-binding protein [Deltaproteobacteria bacterium]
MAEGLNKVMLIGHLGADPVFKSTSANDVCELRLATSESWRGANGDRQEHTEWHRIVVWGKQASVLKEYTRKGSKLYVEGKIKTRKWTDQEGKDRYTTEILANKFIFLDPKKGSDNSGYGSGHEAQGGYGGGAGPEEDEIPF